MMLAVKEGKSQMELPEISDMEITDARESYVEKFRDALIDKYERTSVSIINAGIAGDYLISMAKRAERVKVIREVADEQQMCLADVYAVWEMAKERGCPWEELLANGSNHPGVEGHEVYARVLMKLFE